ncbi:MAG: hypothetical protein FJ318_01380 [SAR202 cluster bacterium]|nr:hypothetical protein [SAR202 cluster bacterium]
MPDSIEVSQMIPATPDEIYEAWLDADKHAEMTGGGATCDARVGGKFTAWDDYISGTILELEPGKRIVQAWRTTEFPARSKDSRLEIVLEAVKGGTRVTLRHSNIPKGQGPSYEQGWTDYYFAPMLEYFGAEIDVD